MSHSNIDTQRRRFMQNEKRRFNDAIRVSHLFLTHTKEGIRKLSKLFMTACPGNRAKLLGVQYAYQTKAQLDGLSHILYTYHDSPIETMEAMNQFITDIINEQDLGLAYVRFGYEFKEYTDAPDVEAYPCGGQDKGARPYFHRNFLRLREQYPDAERLTIENAISAFEFWDRLSKESYQRALDTEDEFLIELHSPSDSQMDMIHLTDEILALKDPYSLP